MKQIPEVLAPAGTLACLKAAVAAGADAVYFGGQAFNARRGAGNFTPEDMKEAVQICKARGVQTNLTLNTLVKQREWPSFLAYLDEILPLGVDAVIVQDLGVAMAVRQRYPQIMLHASTQMAVQSLEGALFLQNQGFQRIVLARELTAEEIRRIRQHTNIELEVFIHGALCYSYSGRCLMSSFHGGRSGNRGACAQPCRLPYEAAGQSGYFLNLKDLCGASHLETLIQAGVTSLKIEGRLKGEAYVAGVTGYYRSLVDEYAQNGKIHPITEAELEPLRQLFNRGGFTDGYDSGKQKMIERSTPKHQGIPVGQVIRVSKGQVGIQSDRTLHAGDELEIRTEAAPYPSVRLSSAMLHGEREAAFYLKERVQPGQPVYRLIDPVWQKQLVEAASQLPEVPLDLCFSAQIGQKAVISSGSCQVMGPVVERALQKELESGAVERQLRKMGGTGYRARQVKVELEKGSFLPVSALNQMRRQLLQKLSQLELRVPQTAPLPAMKKGKPAEDIWMSVSEPGQWEALASMDTRRITTVIVRMEGFSKADRAAFLRLAAGKRVAVQLPPVGRPSHRDWILRELSLWQALGVQDFEANLIGQAQLIRSQGGRVWAGPGLAVMNQQAATFWQEQAESVTVSRELTAREMAELECPEGACWIAYGRVPYMITEQCVYKEVYGCYPAEKGHQLLLKDRKEERMTVRSSCELCYSEILSEKPVYLMGKKGAFGHRRLELTLETPEEAQELWQAVLQGRQPDFPVQTGHWDKGVD